LWRLLLADRLHREPVQDFRALLNRGAARLEERGGSWWWVKAQTVSTRWRPQK
jgi:hypothetical protein